MKQLEYDCGCKFEVVDDRGMSLDDVKTYSVKFPRIKVDIENIPYTCQRTWDIFASGLTRGIWQLETPLGQSWSERLKPTSIAELSALGALLRPGSLHSLSGNPPKSMTQRYVDRKHGLEEVTYIHPALEPILKNTYGVLTFQEQSMKICTDIAGFDLKQADKMRKAIGKKDAGLMLKLEKEFIDGCNKANIVNESQAKEIFNWIRESQKYSFNSSHSCSYSILGYRTAYLKAHFPTAFYAAYLKGAKWKAEKNDEVYDFVQETKINDINIMVPDIINREQSFSLRDDVKNPGIYFGLTDIKGVGLSGYKKLENTLASVDISNLTWLQYLILHSGNIDSTTNKAIISCGVLDIFEKNRKEMLYEYDIWQTVTPGQIKFVLEKLTSGRNYKNLIEVLEELSPTKKEGGGCHSKKDSEKVNNLIKLLKNPPSSLQDDCFWISFNEEKLLCASITCSKADGAEQAHQSNCTCRDFVNGNCDGELKLAVEVNKVKKVKTKRGKHAGSDMAFVDVSDNTGQMSITLFPVPWANFSILFEPNNILLITGVRDTNYKDGTFVVKNVEQL